MIHYSMALLIAVIAWRRRSPRILLTGSLAVVLGAALAAFYLFPAIYEQRWVNIAQSVSAGSRPLDNFLFVHTEDADHDAFNRVISWVVVAEVVLTMVAASGQRDAGSGTIASSDTRSRRGRRFVLCSWSPCPIPFGRFFRRCASCSASLALDAMPRHSLSTLFTAFRN